LSPEQAQAIQIAHDLVDMGVPIFSAPPHSSQEFARPDAWQTFKPNHVQVERWRPGWAMCLVTGVVFDVLDVDPRNGGEAGWDQLVAVNAVPYVYGRARTPSAGDHLLIARTHLAKTSKVTPAGGVDLQAGEDNGEGRGYVYIAPTVRVSKYGPDKGLAVPYRWEVAPRRPDGHADQRMENLIAQVAMSRGVRKVATKPGTNVPAEPDPEWDAFADMATDDWTAESAQRVIDGQVQAVQAAREGEVNNALGGAARLLGRFVAGGFLSEDEAVARLTEALELGGVHSDGWNVANGKKWTAATVIGAGLANGAQEPWSVETPPADTRGSVVGASVAGGAEDVPAAKQKRQGSPVLASVGVPRLRIESAADMSYWLQSVLGSGQLSGYFRRGGQVVHTPRVDEAGYVPARADEDENGPAQIQAVSAPQLTAKIQYAFHCFKEVDEKDPETGKKTGQKREVSALFPLEAAKRATDAPEAMAMLRGLAGITHTPMVRADGSILARPGYDPATRYLFLPGPGVNVPAVPDNPTSEDVSEALGWLERMAGEFPWDSKDDYANYLGLLLTPMLRLVAPPAYKMFFIGAHQPGSGKTLLADVVRILHEGVFRSDMPEDEKEIKSMSTALLATTSAPVIQVDNVTGVLRSSYLAGLLTASGEMTERKLGESANLSFVNDRVWVFTGNNPSLGGDLVRRTILMMINPNMANPETRAFTIPDLKAWTAANRNRLLWSLLVMIRAWVAAGRPLAERRQSDSYATWEATVAGILDVCGVPGAFDQMSGQKAATGGDDDGLSQVLERIWGRHEGKDWSVSEVLEPMGDEWGVQDLDWLPGPVLDRMARSLPAGKKTMGHWLRNRIGRWVTGSDGHSYVIRTGTKDRLGARWKVERA
jgi:hypothetical protein